MSAREIAKGLGQRKGGRYRVAPKEDRTFQGIIFHSAHEMNEWIKLLALERCGTIRKLKRQVWFPIYFGKVKICSYVADFTFEDLEGRLNVADAKGHRTEVYRLKKKMFEACYAPLYILEL